MNLFLLGVFALGACFGVLLMAIFVAGCRDEQIYDDIEHWNQVRERMK